MKLSVLAASASLMAASSAFAADGSVTLSIDPATRLHPIPSTLYGMFFEDINFAGDGGLYPELIANCGFDWKTKTLEGWENDFRGDGMARVTVRYGRPLHPMTAQCLRIEAFGAGAGTGVRNRGYHGICVKVGESYDLSLYLRGLDAYAGNVRVVLENKEGKVVCEHVIANKDMSLGAKRGAGDFPLPAWKRHTAVFTPAETVRDGSVSILLDRDGAIELEQVSLFPQKTFNGRKNGLRKDLVQLLKDMKPGVFRFPGGCITEGNDWTEWYDWKLSVGDGTPYSRDAEPRLLRVLLPLRGHRRGAAPRHERGPYLRVRTSVGPRARLVRPVFRQELQRPRRVRERRREDDDLGRGARQDGPSEAVRPQVRRRRQRELGQGVFRTLRAARRGTQEASSLDQDRRFVRSELRRP